MNFCEHKLYIEQAQRVKSNVGWGRFCYVMQVEQVFEVYIYIDLLDFCR